MLLCYNHVRGGKGLALYETLGCVVFSLYIIYSKKFFRKTFQKRLQFSFCFDIIVLSMRGSEKMKNFVIVSFGIVIVILASLLIYILNTNYEICFTNSENGMTCSSQKIKDYLLEKN